MTISELNKLLLLDPYTFNRTKRGWAKLPKKEQILALTAYILRYVKYNKWYPDIPKAIHEETPLDVRLNLAKCLAKDGQNQEAIIQFEQCLTGTEESDKKILAIIAFLNNDKETFLKFVNTNDKEIKQLYDNWDDTYANAIK